VEREEQAPAPGGRDYQDGVKYGRSTQEERIVQKYLDKIINLGVLFFISGIIAMGVNQHGKTWGSIAIVMFALYVAHGIGRQRGTDD
jgi:hypothetical protein